MESSAFPDELVREIAVLTSYLSPEMATRLGAFWKCCWVHGIDPRNPGHAKTQKMPSRTRRSSTRGTPGGFGSNALTAAYS